jgi:hypothetical protein
VGCDGACSAFDLIVLTEKRDVPHFQPMKEFTAAVTELPLSVVREHCA